VFEIAYSRQFFAGGGGFGAYFPEMASPVILTPKKHLLARKHVMWAYTLEPQFDLWRASRKERLRRSQRCYISCVFGDNPRSCDLPQNLHVGSRPRRNQAKFQKEIFRGFDSTRDRNCHFPVDCLMVITTVQHYCAASDRLLCSMHVQCIDHEFSQRSTCLLE